MIITGGIGVRIMVGMEFVNFVRMFTKFHEIISDEKFKPIELSVNGTHIPLIEENIVTKEAINCNLFSEYEGLKKYLHSDFQNGRYLVLKAVVAMIVYDPILGDFGEEMTPEDNEYWKKIDQDIIEGGKLLYKAYGMDGMRDPLVWSFIPKRFHRTIDILFDGIGEWVS